MTNYPAADATLSSLTLTVGNEAIPLSPSFDPDTTSYLAETESEQVIVEAITTKIDASIVSFTVGDKTDVPELEEDKLTTRFEVMEGGLTDFSLTVKAADGVTLKTYYVLFSRPSEQSLPEILIEASHNEYVAGLGILGFTLSRTGDTASSLDLTVNFTQDQNWLSPTSHDIAIPAGQSATLLTLLPADFPSEVTQSGDLTAVVAPVAGYDTSGATVRVRVISQEGPAVTVFFEHAEYTYPEGAGDVGPILVAVAESAVPFTGNLLVTVTSRSMEANSSSSIPGQTGDYLALSRHVEFAPADFEEVNGSLVARVPAVLTILDDDLHEGDERLGLGLARSPGLSLGVVPLDPDGAECGGICIKDYPVTIVDDDEPPQLRDNLNKDGLGFSGGFRWSFGGILCPRAVFRMLRLLTSPHRGLVADLAGPPAAHRENLGALSPRQQVSRLSAVSRLPSPNSSARRSVFFARPR